MSDEDSWTVTEEHRGRTLTYEKTELDEVRCPECGTEEGIIKTKAADAKTQPVPPELRASCPECGHNDDPRAMRHAWKRERMSDEELEEMRRQREKYEAKMADWQSSAAYHDLQRGA